MIKAENRKKRGRAARNKGASFERALAKLFQAYGYPARRGMVFQGESDVVGLAGIHVECKRQETMHLHQWIEQATAEAKKRNDGLPVVFHKKDRHKVVVSMELDVFMNIYDAYYRELMRKENGE